MLLFSRYTCARVNLVIVAVVTCCTGISGAVKASELRAIRVSVRPEAEQQRILGAGDFIVRLNGKAAPVLNAKTPLDSQMILLVLDLAGDMTDAQAANEALISEIRKLPDSTFVALIRAQDGPTVLVDPTAERSAVAEAIQANAVTGKAGLLDSLTSIESLAEGISKASNVRIATLYVTDSEVHNYREDFANPVINSSDPHDLSRRFPEALIEAKIDKMEKAISALETPLFIVHLRYRTSTLNAAYQAGLKRLADGTGGWSAFCASPAEIPQAMLQAFSAISSQYVLTVGLPNRPPAAIQIHVETQALAQTSGDIVYRARLLIKQR